MDHTYGGHETFTSTYLHALDNEHGSGFSSSEPKTPEIEMDGAEQNLLDSLCSSSRLSTTPSTHSSGNTGSSSYSPLTTPSSSPPTSPTRAHYRSKLNGSKELYDLGISYDGDTSLPSAPLPLPVSAIPPHKSDAQCSSKTQYRLLSCLQCAVKGLPCNKAAPSCSRCARNGESAICVVQRLSKMGTKEQNVAVAVHSDDFEGGNESSVESTVCHELRRLNRG